MAALWKAATWNQFGAAIDMLADAMRACPDELWRFRLWPPPAEGRGWFRFPEFSEFWYLAYHALFWLDLYLTGAEEGFVPPAPFLLIEQDEHGPVPERVYTKEELLGYLAECRQRCQAAIESLSDADAQRRCAFAWGEVSYAELLLYTLRHVQEHAAQLSLALGQQTGYQPGWEASA